MKLYYGRELADLKTVEGVEIRIQGSSISVSLLT